MGRSVSCSVRARKVAPARSIQKRRISEHCELLGRRVAVPQKYTDVDDDPDDGFTFGATVIGGGFRRVSIRYDYTGEEESWPVALVNRWLEPDTDPLTRALEASSL